MRPSRRETGIPLVLGVGAFALALAQRPGWATADTKINLHVAPGRFLAEVASMWTSTGQLGDIQTGQQAGYLFPMGPFFFLGHALGIAPWLVQRLWLGALLAMSAWGVVRLLDALLGRPRGVAQLVGGAVYMLNPFVVTYANRTTVTLLAYAALPWLMLVIHRGIRERGWAWPAAFALLVAASGGGVNGAVTAWMLLGPALLLVYELFWGGAAWGVTRGFIWRGLLLSFLVSLWWVVPAYVQTAHGIDFLRFTEQPGTVWGTTSASESLRLMGFWLSYVGIGFAGRAIPYFDDAHTLLFSVPVVLAGLIVPALALGGFVWTRRWRYGPFFLGLALIAVVIMIAGFPEGTPLRHGLNFTYNHAASLRFLRASYKAGPLLAVALACLLGPAVERAARLGAAWIGRRVGARDGAVGEWSRRGGGRLGALAALVAVALAAVAAWPLVSGVAQDRQVSFKRVPAAWQAAAHDLDRELPVNSRAIVLPGELFGFYRWGGSVDPILPALSRRPVAVRSEVPYADLHATDLLWTVDGLVHQRRLLPGELGPLLSLAGVRSVVTGTDDDLARSDAPAPADAAAELSAFGGLQTPARTYGRARLFSGSDLNGPALLPQVRRYDLPSARGLVRVQPAAAPVIVDGSAAGLAELGAFGAAPSGRTILYAGDLSPAQLAGAAGSGADVVITDSARRQAFVSSRLEQNTGPVLGASETLPANGLMLDPFGRGPAFQTVAELSGVRAMSAPASPERPQFPEHAPFAAFDGSPQTAWLADPTLDPSRWWLQVDLQRPSDVPYVDLLPYSDAGGAVREVQIAGRSFAVHPGWNRLALGLRGATGLRVRLARVGPAAAGAARGAGGIAELRIPGVAAGQDLRLPVDAAGELAGRPLDGVGLTYLFSRVTGDDPFARQTVHGPWSALNVGDAGDAERALSRSFDVPAARSFSADAWVSVDPAASDDALDRLEGYRGPLVATSSARFEGRPRWRASRALDGDPVTAWIAPYRAGRAQWLAWHSPRPMSARILRLLPPAQMVARPTLVRVSWPGGQTPPLAVDRGRVVLPFVVRARELRLDVLVAAAPAGASPAERSAVGIAEVQGVAGMPRASRSRPPQPPGRALDAPCGSVSISVAGRTVGLAVRGSVGAFEAGDPLPARGCGGPVALARGIQHLTTSGHGFLVDDLRLRSAGASVAGASGAGAAAAAPLPSGTVLNAGHAGRGRYDNVRVAITAPSWLVLGEGYNRGWRAWCNGRSLGTPQVVDGYANGWRVGPGCQNVRFAYAPQSEARIGYLISAIAAAACLLLLGSLALRGRRRSQLPPPAAFPSVDAPRPWAPAAAAVGAVAGAVGFGFVFGVWAGLVALLGLAVVLWRGVGPRPLIVAAAALLLVVVPLIYVADSGGGGGANNFSYASDRIGAHWVAVAAIVLLVVALVRTLAAGRAPARAGGEAARAGGETRRSE